MSADVYRIFDLRMCEISRESDQALERMMAATFAKYRVDHEYWQSGLILDPLYDVIQSRYEMRRELDYRVSPVLNSGRTKNELNEIRKNLTTGPRRVRLAFHNKIISAMWILKIQKRLPLSKPRAISWTFLWNWNTNT